MEASIVLIVLFFYMLIQSVFTMVIIVKLGDKKSTLATKEELKESLDAITDELAKLRALMEKN